MERKTLIISLGDIYIWSLRICQNVYGKIKFVWINNTFGKKYLVIKHKPAHRLFVTFIHSLLDTIRRYYLSLVFTSQSAEWSLLE